jgi:hypothetical protein
LYSGYCYEVERARGGGGVARDQQLRRAADSEVDQEVVTQSNAVHPAPGLERRLKAYQILCTHQYSLSVSMYASYTLQAAVSLALSAKDVALVHGPPGKECCPTMLRCCPTMFPKPESK